MRAQAGVVCPGAGPSLFASSGSDTVRENNLSPAGALDCSHWVPRTYVPGLHSDAPPARHSDTAPQRSLATSSFTPIIPPYFQRRHSGVHARCFGPEGLQHDAFLQMAIRMRPFCERQFGTSNPALSFGGEGRALRNA